MDWLKKMLLGNALSLLASFLQPQMIKDLIDRALDFIENKVLGTASTIDDKMVLPIMAQLRAILAIPDGDGSLDNIPEAKNKLFANAITALVGFLDGDLIKDLLDDIFDYVENKVLGSASTIDDQIVLPAISALRIALNVPDGDD